MGPSTDHDLTFRCNTDIGPLPLFHLTSSGQLNLQINFMRSKDIPPMVVRDVVLKLESNFIREYDEVEYPSDVFVPIDELFHTENQLESFSRLWKELHTDDANNSTKLEFIFFRLDSSISLVYPFYLFVVI